MKAMRKKTACLSMLLAACTALLLESLRPPTTLAPVAGKNVNSCVAGGQGRTRGDKEEVKTGADLKLKFKAAADGSVEVRVEPMCACTRADINAPTQM